MQASVSQLSPAEARLHTLPRVSSRQLPNLERNSRPLTVRHLHAGHHARRNGQAVAADGVSQHRHRLLRWGAVTVQARGRCEAAQGDGGFHIMHAHIKQAHPNPALSCDPPKAQPSGPTCSAGSSLSSSGTMSSQNLSSSTAQRVMGEWKP